MTTITATYQHFRGTSEPVTITLPDRLDVHAIDEVEHRVRCALDSGRADIGIDGTAVKHADQAGIDSLRAVRRSIQVRGGQCVLTPSTALRVAFELVVGERLDNRPQYVLEAA